MTNSTDSDWRHLLTEKERAWMLDDIARVSLAVGRQSLPDRPWDDLDVTAHSLAERKSPVERLGFIERALPLLTRTIHQIQETPLTLMERTARRVAPPIRARRVEATAILAAIRIGHAERHLEERAATWSPDTPENRAVKAFLTTLRRDAGIIGGIAAAAGEDGVFSATKTAAMHLSGLESLPLWEAVGDQDEAWRVPPSHRMLADGRYARLAETMRRYRQSFQFDWATPLFTLPSRETWRLYEVWGLFRTLEALLALGYSPALETGAAHALFTIHHDRLTFSLVKGLESRLRLTAPGRQPLSLFYNRTYPQQTGSLSRAMQPDLALERDGGLTWVLDPKFKAYDVPGSEGDDLDQMHAYRDAIIGADGRKTVTRAWCLFCGTADGTRPMIAYGHPASSIVGALRLRPGDPAAFERLCQLLAAWGL